MQESTRYHILKQIQDNPSITQRELSKNTGLSLGKTNYCLHALMDKGLVKARNFKNSKNRVAYSYFLTPQGIEENVKVTYRFLKQKMAEYNALQKEIKELKQEMGESDY